MLQHVELRVPQFEHSLQRLQNLPRTGQGMLFHGFQWFSMVFRMMALQFLLVRFGSSHSRFGSFYLGRCLWCNGVNIVVLTVDSFWIVVACNASDMNQWQWKRMVLAVIHGNVVLGHAPTCSTLRCVKLFVRGLCKPVLITPMMMEVFWYLQGSLQDSFFANVFQTIFRQMFNLVDFQLDQYVLWSSFSFSSVTIWSLCAVQTSFNQHGSSVVLTRTCSNTPNSEFINMNRVYNGCQTKKPTTYRATHDFPWFSLVFMGFPNDGIAVPLGPLWFLPSWTRSWCNGVNMVILTVGGLVSNTSDVNEWQTRGACGNQG